ncbi:MAG TPA: hypothetical protein VKU44_06880 [Terriglobia bacterium]|nr:hypothetical protein [Terriglobia bacterium]
MAAYYSDSYVTARPPVYVIPVTAVKVINGADKKYGPPKPGSRAGAGQAHPDTFFE